MSRILQSTTALGHIGTGIGKHSEDWVHYKSPDKNDQRAKFTKFDFTAADAAISAASASQGKVKLSAKIYDNQMGHKCSSCQEFSIGGSTPNYNGCKVTRAGRHDWRKSNTWTLRPALVDVDLYYDKSGATTTVSIHRQ